MGRHIVIHNHLPLKRKTQDQTKPKIESYNGSFVLKDRFGKVIAQSDNKDMLQDGLKKEMAATAKSLGSTDTVRDAINIDLQRLKDIPTDKLKFIVGVGEAGLGGIWPKGGKDIGQIKEYMVAAKAELARRAKGSKDVMVVR